MSTITKEFTKEQLQQIIETDHVQCGEASALARIALASLEAEPVAYIRSAHNPDGFCFADGIHPTHRHQRLPLSTLQDGCYWKVTPLYTALPAPVAVPDEIQKLKDGRGFKYVKAGVHYSVNYANGWNQCRAAMLQGANGTLTNEGTIPVTQFKPVADLYGLTSPTGGETSFTFDAVEARDFIDGGWSCQEYVELGRYQEALTDHPEDNLDMVYHSGDANEKGNSSVIPDCSCRTCRPVTMTDMRFIVCPECGNKRCPHANDHRNSCTGSNEPGQEGGAYPAAPQQEVK